MKKIHFKCVDLKSIKYIIFVVFFLFATIRSFSQVIKVSVNTDQPNIAISENVLGLSYETSIMAPDVNGLRYFRPDNRPLLQLFKTLGIKNLRIGGNSVDDPKVALPRLEDVRSFFEFAKLAKVKVIFSVRLENGEPQNAASYAKLIHDNYADILESFAIGNEPSYYKNYHLYLTKWKIIRDAILSVYPDAKFSGPDQNPNPELIKKIARDLGNPSGHLTQITQHLYPFGCSYKNPEVAWNGGDVTKLSAIDVHQAQKKMLSPDAYKIYEQTLSGFSDAVKGSTLSYRLTETNSFWFSGLQGASDSYLSALWGLDYLHWWAAKGAKGLNFHNGDRTGGSVNLPCRYAAFVSQHKGFEVRPLAYGLMFYSLSGTGYSLPVTVTNNLVLPQNIAAYAVLNSENEVFVTLINKNTNIDLGAADIKITLNQPFVNTSTQAIYLTSKWLNKSLEPYKVLLGGSAITKNGHWAGKWKTIPSNADSKTIDISLSPASAVILKIKRIE